jgi:hypothetical protein
MPEYGGRAGSVLTGSATRVLAVYLTFGSAIAILSDRGMNNAAVLICCELGDKMSVMPT